MFHHAVCNAARTGLLIVAICTQSRAAITDYHVDHTPLVVGQTAIRTVYDDGTGGPFPTNYIWEWKPTGGTTWIPFQNSGTFQCSSVESAPGSGTVRVTVQYLMDSPRPPDTVISHTFTVFPPDTEVITSTLPATVTDAFNDFDYPLTFVYKYGTTAVLMGAEVTMKEKITNFSLFGVSQPDMPDFDNPDPSRFSFTMNTLTDLKRYTYNKTRFDWAMKTVGDVFCEYDQQNQMIYYDVAGVQRTIEFPVRHFKYKIGADGKWILSQ